MGVYFPHDPSINEDLSEYNETDGSSWQAPPRPPPMDVLTGPSLAKLLAAQRAFWPRNPICTLFHDVLRSKDSATPYRPECTAFAQVDFLCDND